MRKIILILILSLAVISVNSQAWTIGGNEIKIAWSPQPPIDGFVGAYPIQYYTVSEPIYTPSDSLFYINTSNVVIENKSFTNVTTAAIQLYEVSNVIIRNCKFKNMIGKAIASENPVNLLVENCVFDSVGDGVIVTTNASHTYNGGYSTNVKVEHNYFKNIIGGWPRHHAVQFAGLTDQSLGKSTINYNTFEMIHLQSFVDDIISTYGSSGSISDSIQIIGNWLRGGDYNAENHTGSGITFGDNYGSYIHVKNNIAVNLTSGAIGNAGGHDCIVENNTIYQSQALANPSNSADGYIMYNFNPTPTEADCYNNTWRYNSGYWLTNNGTDVTYRALDYSTNNCQTALETSTNISDPTLTAEILPSNISHLYHYDLDEKITDSIYTNSSNVHYWSAGNLGGLVIENLNFTDSTAINIEISESSNAIIRNCRFSQSQRHAIHLVNCDNITIENCVFDSINGIMAEGYSASPYNGGTCSNIKIFHNYFKNTVGNNWKNHSVQLAGVSGGGCEISYNSFEMPNSLVDDVISCYACFNPSSSPMIIKNNWIRNGNNSTGSGIMVGDSGGSYFNVTGNILVNIVATGIGNAGGNHVNISNNILLKTQASSISGHDGTGIFSTNFSYPTQDCSSNTVSNNWVVYYQYNGTMDNIGASNNCGILNGFDGVDTNIYDLSLNESILPTKISNLFHY